MLLRHYICCNNLISPGDWVLGEDLELRVVMPGIVCWSGFNRTVELVSSFTPSVPSVDVAPVICDGVTAGVWEVAAERAVDVVPIYC